MRDLLLIVAVVLPTLAAAQEADPVPSPAPAPAPVVVVQPPPAAVPTLPDWNLGAGLGINLGGVGFSSGGLVGSAGLGGLGGAGGLGGLAGGLGASLGAAPQPRMTLLIERRLSERLWLGFQGTVTYGAHQSPTSSYSYRSLNAEGSIGLRRIFNPRGIIEVSAFGAAGVGYANAVVHYVVNSIASVQVPQWIRAETFSVGAAAGLTLERELVSGLALRLSSSILGFSYSSSNSGSRASTPGSTTSNGIDVGLRFNPSIELRYAF